MMYVRSLCRSPAQRDLLRASSGTGNKLLDRVIGVERRGCLSTSLRSNMWVVRDLWHTLTPVAQVGLLQSR